MASQPSCCTALKDGLINIVSCSETGWEGLWSPAESGSYNDMNDEHWQAHDDADRRRDLAFLRHNARRIYATTEPGNPARRGIGPYL